MKSVLASAGLGVGVWLSAVIGMALKLALAGDHTQDHVAATRSALRAARARS
jgi:hypothetical protein